MHKIYLTALGTLLCLLLLLLPAKAALADGTETLGPPNGITVAAGTGIVAAGTGMVDQPGTISITVPAGATVKQVLLYWEGQMSTEVPGDSTIRVNGTTNVTGVLIGGPAFFFGGAYSSAFRADITALNVITSGSNTVTLDSLTYSKIANGAGILVIYDEGTTPAVIDLRDGVDLAYHGFPEPRQNTIEQTFTFAPATMTRTANIIIFASSVESAASGEDHRPDSVEVTVNGVKTIISNPLNSHDGDEWDTLELQVDIPAGATTMSMRLFSRDDENTTFNPASMSWIGVGFAIVPPAAAITIEKATNGEDADLPTGPAILVGNTVTWTYVVTNTGAVTLNNVVVNDDQIGAIDCPQTTLIAGASMTCIATGIAVAGQYANMSTVIGTPEMGGPNVTDEDPSHYIGIPLAGIGDLVFRDTNNNGLQDSGEAGVDGVTVELYNTDNTLISTTVTSGGGLYLFDNLPPGDYYLLFINTVGNDSCTIPNAGDDASDSDGIPSGTDPRGPTCTTTPTTLSPGETDLTWDLGLIFAPASILLEKATNGEDADLPTGPQIRVGDAVTWSYEVTNTGAITLTSVTLTDDQIGVISCPESILAPGASMLCTATGTAVEGQYANLGTVVGTTVNSTTTVTDTDPSHYFGYIPAAVGDLVFGDINPTGATPEDIAAGNGIQDGVAQEGGIAGIIVKLYASDGTLISTTVTADDGSYLFDNLVPGDYYLVFVNPGLGIWTDPNVGDNEAVDSDAATVVTDPDGVALQTAEFNLSSGETDRTWDAGLIGLSGAASAAVGNRVWIDENQNGIQDNGEVGFPGATVQLYSSDGTLLKEVQTNDQGIYNFENLDPGDYFITFIPPSNYILTEQKVGSDDEVDSDIDPDTGRTITFTLVAFETTLRFDLGIFAPTSLDPDEEPQQLHIYLPMIQLPTTAD